MILYPSYKVNLAAESAKPTMRAKVYKLEEAMLSQPQAECPVRHHFGPGMYAREITIPKGVVLIGAVHRKENLAILSKGKLEIVTESGTATIEAPWTGVVKPGAKNCAVALEESVWTNFFATDETDPDKLVEELTFSKASELLGGKDNPQLICNQRMKELEKST